MIQEFDDFPVEKMVSRGLCRGSTAPLVGVRDARARPVRTSTRDNDGVPCANSGHSFHSHFTVTVPADGSWGRQCWTAAPAGMSLVLSSSPSSLAPCCLTIYHAFRYAPQDVRLRSVERCNWLQMCGREWCSTRAYICLFRSFCLSAVACICLVPPQQRADNGVWHCAQAGQRPQKSSRETATTIQPTCESVAPSPIGGAPVC